MQAELQDMSDSHLAALIAPLKSRTRKSFANWADAFKVWPRGIYLPESQADVQLLIEYARRQGFEVRAVGAGHSPSDLVCTEDLMISLDKMNKVVSVRLLFSFHTTIASHDRSIKRLRQ